MWKQISVKKTCCRIINRTCISNENVSEMGTTCTRERGLMIHEHYMYTLSHKRDYNEHYM